MYHLEMTVTMTAAPFFSDYGGSWRLIFTFVHLQRNDLLLPLCFVSDI